ncbi:hypothetical protein Gpo141_00008834 [Globisporangium polare]
MLAVLLLLLAHVLWRATLVSRARTRLWKRAQRQCNNKRSRGGGGRDGVLLAQSFHAPLYWLSGVLVVLRMTLYVLVEVGAFAGTDGVGDDRLASWKASAFFWLLEMPSVLLVALYGYLVLFYASVVHLHRWPTRIGCSSWVSVAFVGFCALLSLLATLFACLRGALLQVEQQQQHKHHHHTSNSATTPQLTEAKVTSMHAEYSALVWGVLALLLLKYQAQCTQFLWRERRNHRLRALNAKNLHAMAVGSTLLAAVLLLRAVVTLLFTQEPLNLSTPESFLSELLPQYVGWELLILGVLLKMLSKIPIAYDYSVAHVTPSPLPPGSQIELVFHVPKLRDLVNDFVVTTSHSLQQRARVERYDRLFFDEAEERDRHSLSSQRHCSNCDSGSSTAECDCESSSLLSQAHVALLSAEYPVGRRLVDHDDDDDDEEDEYIRRSLLVADREAEAENDQEINTLPLYFG